MFLVKKKSIKHKDRAEYGAEVLKRLAKDLNVGETFLHRCFQFARKYPRLPIFAGRQKFSWSHYRQLITISDDKKRLSLERAVSRNDWSSDELASRINDERPELDRSSVTKDERRATRDAPLIPLRGTPYTYQIIDRPDVKDGKSGLRLDLGFGVFLKADSRPCLPAGRSFAAFSKGDIVESRPHEDAYRFTKTSRTAKDLYTYWAEIEKIIDGDTLKVRFDLG